MFLLNVRFNIIKDGSYVFIMQKLVITTKSVEYMPFFLSLFSLLNGISWTIYALIRFDPYIVVSHYLLSLSNLKSIDVIFPKLVTVLIYIKFYTFFPNKVALFWLSIFVIL